MKKKILVKLIIAIILTIIIGAISNTFMPLLGNDVAIGQLQNDDAYFIAMQAWYTAQYWLGIAAALIWIITGGLIAKDMYNYIKNKKENM